MSKLDRSPFPVRLVRRATFVFPAQPTLRSATVRLSRCEALERRRLLAAAAYLAADGTLFADGTAAAEQIDVGVTSAGDFIVWFNRVQQPTFAGSAVKRVRVRGFGGNDELIAGERSVEQSFTLEGGDGHDVIRSIGAGTTSVIGGAGDDTLHIGFQTLLTGFDGGGGLDTIVNEQLADDLDLRRYPTVEDARVRPNVDSVIIGNSLNNRITVLNEYGEYAASVRGQEGNDTLVGGAGNDTLAGESGNDSLIGNAGSDVLNGGGGADMFRGGDGTDTADYSDRGQNLTIGLGTLPDDGAPGERDNVWNDIETLLGGTGHDALKGSAAANVLRGGEGNDTLQGLGGSDTLTGDTGNDRLDGGAGYDALDGGAGMNTYLSGESIVRNSNSASIDPSTKTLVVHGSVLPEEIYLRENETGVTVFDKSFVRGSFTSIVIRGFDGDDLVRTFNVNLATHEPLRIEGGNGHDQVGLGGTEAIVLGGAGDDRVNVDYQGTLLGYDGGAGSDWFVSADTDYFDLNHWPSIENAQITQGILIGNATDNILVAIAPSRILGNGGNDRLSVEEGMGSLLDGGDGDDRINAAHGAATLWGGAGDDTLTSGDGNATLDGGDGNDRLEGYYDRMGLGGGDNLLLGGAGNDWLIGGGGNDTLIGGTGADTLQGAEGNDTADYGDRTANLTIGLGSLSDDGEAGEKDNVWLDIETVVAGSGNDHVKGHANSNLLLGNAGNDTLLGLGGNDTLDGAAGTDSLDGDGGVDTAVNPAGDAVTRCEATLVSSAIVTADRTLLVTGTPLDDVVRFTHGSPDEPIGVMVRGILSIFRYDAFDRVRVNALGGDDWVEKHAPDFPLGQELVFDLGAGDDQAHLFLTKATVFGGDGTDTTFVIDAVATFHGGDGIDMLDVDNAEGGPDIDLRQTATTENARIYSGRLIGNALDNMLGGYGPSVTILGMGGHDHLDYTGSDPVRLDGGDGRDTLLGGPEADQLVGAAGDDLLEGRGGADTLDAGDGDDWAYAGGGGGSLVLGGRGDDHLFGNTGKDTINGGADGNDYMLGGAGDDTLVASTTGNNRLLGWDGNDTLLGGNGNDTLDGGPGSDLMKGGGGADTADYSERNRNLVIGLGTLADDGEAGEKDNVWFDIETLFGGSGNDTLRGSAGRNFIHGNAGNDWIRAGAGDDTLAGGAGTDTLDGESGYDTAVDAEADFLLSIEHKLAFA